MMTQHLLAPHAPVAERRWHLAPAQMMLALGAPGRVAWWPVERRDVTLHRVLVYVVAETDRHAGHADVVRELIDGAAGLREGNDNLAPGDRGWWQEYRSRLQDVADGAGRSEVGGTR